MKSAIWNFFDDFDKYKLQAQKKIPVTTRWLGNKKFQLNNNDRNMITKIFKTEQLISQSGQRLIFTLARAMAMRYASSQVKSSLGWIFKILQKVAKAS